jgi:two-component system, LytTR family, response regulator LytT
VINIAICDDELIFRNEISKTLNKYSKEFKIEIHIQSFESGERLLSSNNRFDLYFLDYIMNGINGIETAKTLRDRKVKAPIVYMTFYKEAMQDAFKVNAFRYIFKENNEEELYHCMDDYIAEYCTYEQIKVDTQNGYRIIPCNNIQFITSAHNGSELWTSEGLYQSMNSLNDWVDMLDHTIFFRSHKNSIVNLSYINRVDKVIELTNGERVEISRRKKKSLQESLTNYISKYTR